MQARTGAPTVGAPSRTGARKPPVQEWALARILETLERDGATLDIGCGTGSFTRALAALGVPVVCVDLAREHDPIPGVAHTSGVDVTRKLPFDHGSFRSVIALEVIEHLTNPFTAVAEMARVLQSGGRLYLTLPNFWKAHSRWRFLMRGSVNRSHVRDPVAQRNLREGGCPPHINTMPWPTLKYALVSFGFEVEDVSGYQRRPLRQLSSLPLAAAIWVTTRLSRRSRRERFDLDEANRWSVLFGSHHVFVRARKVAPAPPES